jgi:hypothetical protein
MLGIHVCDSSRCLCSTNKNCLAQEQKERSEEGKSTAPASVCGERRGEQDLHATRINKLGEAITKAV